MHIPQSSGTSAQAGPPLSAPQPVDLGEFFALIRPPFKQLKQKQHLNQPGFLPVGDLFASCCPSAPGPMVNANSSGLYIIFQSALSPQTSSLPAFVNFETKLCMV